MADQPLPVLRDRLLSLGTAWARLLPKGTRTVHRMLWRLLGAPRRFFVQVDSQWFCVDARDLDISLTICLTDIWEPAASAAWVALLSPGMTVLDVGANKGWFSLIAAGRVGEQGRVISYEPLPRNHLDISATAAANNHVHWLVRPVAVSGGPGEATLSSPADDSGSGWGSLETSNRPSITTTRVEAVRLDDELDSLGVSEVDLLKMDIEGHEHEALNGALTLLRSGRIRRLLVEVHAKRIGADKVRELFELMGECGFRAELLDEEAHSAGAWARMFREGGGAALESLRPISGVDDPAVSGADWYKVLFSRTPS